MKRIALPACFLLIHLFVFAQSGFIPSIVVNNNGDSLKGEIDYRNWKKTPGSIDFISQTGAKQSLDPTAIKSFYITESKERYESHLVDVDMTSRDYDKVIASRIIKPVSEQKQIFMLQLIKSSLLSLYVYSDYNKIHLYYSKNNDKPVELIDYYLYIEEGGQLRHNTDYKEQLKVLLAECPAAVQKVNGLIYAENPVKKVIAQYLQCVNPSSVAEVNKDDSFTFKFGAVLGAVYNSFSIEGESNYNGGEGEIAGYGYSSNVSPLIGVSLDITLPRNNNRFHIVNELVYKNYKTSNSFSKHTVLYDYTNDIDMSFSYLQVNTIIRYDLSKSNTVRPFINIGIGNGYLFKTNKNSSRLTYSTGNVKNIDAVDGPSKYERSFLAGAGVKVKNLLFEARYANGNGFSPFVRLKSKVSSPQILFTYQF